MQSWQFWVFVSFTDQCRVHDSFNIEANETEFMPSGNHSCKENHTSGNYSPKEVQLYCKENGVYLIFEEPQRGVARGQFAAWYKGEELIGSGVIG